MFYALQEWVLASRIADHDETGLRLDGRTAIRPFVTHDSKVSSAVSAGTIVDAWWHDGWWEGIVIQTESNEKLQVYFPGMKLSCEILNLGPPFCSFPRLKSPAHIY